jgi:hypothetical protein
MTNQDNLVFKFVNRVGDGMNVGRQRHLRDWMRVPAMPRQVKGRNRMTMLPQNR